jgi:prepilin-type N-terminal cleavage/methylation domain-containing protein
MGHAKHRRNQGYTLVELMVVVVIVAILAAVAIPAFRNYVMQARTTEGYDFLGEIHLREEGYRAEFGRYCPALLSPAAAASPLGTAQAFVPVGVGWTQLGALPDSAVRFQYEVLAGDPGTATGIPSYPNTDYWFISHAVVDLNGNGIQMAMEGYAPSSRVYLSQGINGPPLPGYWE